MAIPKIVAALQSRGFQFVTVASLLGRSRDEVMPLVPPESRWQTWLDSAAFGVINWTAASIHWLFLLGIVLGIARLLFIGTLALWQSRRRRRAVFDPTIPLRWRWWCPLTTKKR